MIDIDIVIHRAMLSSSLVVKQVQELQFPVMIIHGTEDQIVPFDHSLQLYSKLQNKSDPYWVEGAGHNDVAERREYLWAQYDARCEKENIEGLSLKQQQIKHRRYQGDVFSQIQESERKYYEVISEFATILAEDFPSHASDHAISELVEEEEANGGVKEDFSLTSAHRLLIQQRKASLAAFQQNLPPGMIPDREAGFDTRLMATFATKDGPSTNVSDLLAECEENVSKAAPKFVLAANARSARAAERAERRARGEGASVDSMEVLTEDSTVMIGQPLPHVPPSSLDNMALVEMAETTKTAETTEKVEKREIKTSIRSVNDVDTELQEIKSDLPEPKTDSGEPTTETL